VAHRLVRRALTGTTALIGRSPNGQVMDRVVNGGVNVAGVPIIEPKQIRLHLAQGRIPVPGPKVLSTHRQKTPACLWTIGVIGNPQIVLGGGIRHFTNIDVPIVRIQGRLVRHPLGGCVLPLSDQRSRDVRPVPRNAQRADSVPIRDASSGTAVEFLVGQ